MRAVQPEIFDEYTIPLEELQELGLSEYESKVYLTLSILKVATAKSLDTICGVPRTRIYPTLKSLADKGFILRSNEQTGQYKLVEHGITVEQVRAEKIQKLTNLKESLMHIQNSGTEWLSPDAGISGAWAVDIQIRRMIADAKVEVILLISDPDFLDKYKNEIERVYKKIHVYPILKEASFAKETKFKCYLGGKLIRDKIFNPDKYAARGIRHMVTIEYDRRDYLSVVELPDGSLRGNIGMDKIFMDFVCEGILRNAELIRRV
ncbi:MAG: helix-turn-helix domain-containing protein [Methanocorpusculum sp.]|nr:helix-turn-helix domain-containing protein [Methanocorpusculum sp.]